MSAPEWWKQRKGGGPVRVSESFGFLPLPEPEDEPEPTRIDEYRLIRNLARLEAAIRAEEERLALPEGERYRRP